MGNDKFKEITSKPHSLVTLGGSTGSGKSEVILNFICEYLLANHSTELFNHHLNQLTPLLNGSTPVYLISGENPFGALCKIKSKLFPESSYPFNPILHTYNFCKVSPDNTPWDEIKRFCQTRQVKLLILDGVNLSRENLMELHQFSQENNLMIFQTLSTYRKMDLSGGNSLALSSSAMQLSSLVLKTSKTSKPHTYQISVVKDRFNSIQESSFEYECSKN